MPIIVGGTIIEGAEPPEFSGATGPVAGTDEIQTITIGGTPETGSTFLLTYDGWAAPVAWIATSATLVSRIDAALEALPNIGTAGVTTADGTSTNGVGTFTVTFVAQNGKLNQSLIVGSAFLQSTGVASTGTVAVATTTPGVDATGRGAPKGTHYTDSAAGIDYVNTGTALAPTWTAISVASIAQEIIDVIAAIPTAAVAAVAGLGITIAASDPTAVAAADGTTVAEADAPAGGTGAAAGGWDTAGHRDTAIALINSLKVQANILITEATELKAKAAVERTELTELKLDIGTLSTTAVETKTQLNALLVALRTAGIVTP